MEWVKERLFKYSREDQSYVDTEHVIFLKHRSDGTMWYQVARWIHISKADIEPEGRIATMFDYFLMEKKTSPEFSDQEFDAQFDEMMQHNGGVEITVDDLPNVN